MNLLKKIEELEKELKNKELHSLYLLYGEEQYLLEQKLKKNKRTIWKMYKWNKLYSNRRN